jgi:spermidine synthase
MREILDRRNTQKAEIQLQCRGPETYEIIYNGVFLMASYNDRSEKMLARAVLDRLPPVADGYRILVGGLGMGFTLQEVFACPDVHHVVVVEIEQAIIDWNRRYFNKLNGSVLNDPRGVVVRSDLFDFVHATRGRFHAILVDVDNGPNWLALDDNARLYSEETLRTIKTILTTRGILATWSAQEDRAYWNRLNAVFPITEAIRVAETRPKASESIIYLAATGS